MASILRVDTLTDASSNNSIATSIIYGGAVRAWANFDGSATDAAARDSFNVSSMADRGTGLSTITLSNAMNNSNYAGTTSCMGTWADDDGRNYIAVAMPKDTDEVYVNQFGTGGSAADGAYVGVHITGDPA